MSETQQKEFSSNKLYEKQPLREKFQSLTIMMNKKLNQIINGMNIVVK